MPVILHALQHHPRLIQKQLPVFTILGEMENIVNLS